jgi:hypothetical protein
MKFKIILAVACTLFLGQILFAQPKTEIVNNKSIIDLHKAGVEDDLIIAKIRSSECKFDLTTNGLIDLKNKGVPSSLIRVMMNKSEGKSLNEGIETTPPVTSKATNDKGKLPKTVDAGSVDLLNYVYSWNASSRSAKPLEKSIAEIKHKQQIVKAESMWKLEGEHSGVRLNVTETVQFIINTGSNLPPNLILYKLTVRRKYRDASYQRGTFNGLKDSDDMIAVSVSKAGDGLFTITPGTTLKRGEYFFTMKPSGEVLSVEAFAFGID